MLFVFIAITEVQWLILRWAPPLLLAACYPSKSSPGQAEPAKKVRAAQTQLS